MSLKDDKTIELSDLTGGEVAGNGAFDELMRAVKAHLAEEYSKGRITGDMYAQAYISAVDMAMGNANTFLLQRQITNQQVRLLDAQIENEELNKQLIQKQIDKLEQDTLYVSKQVEKADSDIALVDAQVDNQAKQGLVLDQTVANAMKDLEVKDTNITAQEAQTAMVVQQTVNAESQDDQIKKQTLKIQAEIDVLEQRAISELAQTSNTVNGQPIGGVLGKQVELYQNQADGYLRDAEQKAAKIFNDTLLTRITTEYDNASAANAGMSDTDVLNVMNKLRSGIGL